MTTVTVVRKEGRIVIAAAEFHDETGLPMQSFAMDMNPDVA